MIIKYLVFKHLGKIMNVNILSHLSSFLSIKSLFQTLETELRPSMSILLYIQNFILNLKSNIKQQKIMPWYG